MFLQYSFLDKFLDILIYFVANCSEYFMFLFCFNLIFAIIYIIKYIINLKR